MIKKKIAMKKTYIIPEIMVVKVQTAQIMATSLLIQGEAKGNTMLSRQGGAFLDDDSDDEEY